MSDLKNGGVRIGFMVLFRTLYRGAQEITRVWRELPLPALRQASFPYPMQECAYARCSKSVLQDACTLYCTRRLYTTTQGACALLRKVLVHYCARCLYTTAQAPCTMTTSHWGRCFPRCREGVSPDAGKRISYVELTSCKSRSLPRAHVPVFSGSILQCAGYLRRSNRGDQPLEKEEVPLTEGVNSAGRTSHCLLFTLRSSLYVHLLRLAIGETNEVEARR